MHPLPPIIDLGEKTQVTPVDILRLWNHTFFFPFSVGLSETIFWKILFGDESLVEWGSQKNTYDEKIFLFFIFKKILKIGKIGKKCKRMRKNPEKSRKVCYCELFEEHLFFC